MKIAISAKPTARRAQSIVRRAIEKLSGVAEIVLAEDAYASIGRPSLPHAPLESISADLLVAIGGDGTFLWSLQRTTIPMLAVNAGTVGFLAEIDGRDLPAVDDALARLLRGDYLVEDRMKVAAEFDGTNLPDATNEIVVHTSQVAKMRLFEIAVDGRPLGRIRADGIVLATPTGSTSYSLSALGPIVDPGLDAIVLTPLNPFQTSPRAVLVDPTRTVSVRLVHPEKAATAVVDGQTESEIPGGSTIVAYRSPRPASFVRFGAGFYERLSRRRILPWSEPSADGEGDADLPPPA